jgi:DNA-binding response OmpR family regulator
MAKVFLTGIDESVANRLKCVLAIEKHRIEHRPFDASIDDFLDAEIVFAGGDPKQYLSLLRGLRQANPGLPFVVVTRIPNTSEWLDALDAGATDYCSPPFGRREINWLMDRRTACPDRKNVESWGVSNTKYKAASA